MYDFVFSVIEAKRIPGGMFPAVISVKVLIVCTVESSQTFHFVFNGVGMHDIHNYGDTQFVCGIYQLFQFVGSPEP